MPREHCKVNPYKEVALLTAAPGEQLMPVSEGHLWAASEHVNDLTTQ